MSAIQPTPSTIRLRRSHSSQPRAAWLLSGSTPAEWFHLLNASGVLLTLEQRWYLIPRSTQDREVLGALVTGLSAIPQIPGCVPYTLIGERLYIPADAELSPPLLDRELKELLSDQYAAYVWHPAAGLVGFEPHEALTASKLWLPPPCEQIDGSRTQPGTLLNTRLRSLRGLPPKVEQIISEAQGDIGSERPQNLGKDSPLPGAAGAAAGMVLAPLAWLGQKLSQGLSALGKATGTAGAAAAGASAAGKALSQIIPSGLMQTLNSWNEWMSRVTTELLDQRQREINRLMDLLEQNPDEGLKYALPFGGDQLPRGLAPPSGSLLSRNTDFRMGGGAGAADVWQIPFETQQKLLQKYRDLAQRELALGRYRRAAYIYAELLNDFTSAAAALKQGRFFREAAAIYKDKLRQIRTAAECLEHGGLLDEAIPLFEELQDFEHAGDLLARLERLEEARTRWQTAVERNIIAHKRTSAAQIQEFKLLEPRDALQTLQQGWPYATQAEECLSEEFRLCARHGWHSEAHKRIQILGEDYIPGTMQPVLVKVLVQQAHHQTDRTNAALAADTARLVTSRVLLGDARYPRELVLQHLRGLEPADQLHFRDCTRYGQANEQKSPKTIPLQKVRLRRVIPLNRDIEWLTAVSTGKAYYVAGRLRQRLVVLAGLWQDGRNRFEWVHWETESHLERVLLAVDERVHMDYLVVQPSTGTPLPTQKLKLSETGPEALIGLHPGLPSNVLGVTAPGGLVWYLEANGYTLKSTDRQGLPIHHFDLFAEDPEQAPFSSASIDHLPMMAHDAHHIYVTFEADVICVNRNAKSYHWLTRAQAPITSLSAIEKGRASLVAFVANGVLEVHDTVGQNVRYGDILEGAQVLFLPDRRLVVVSPQGGILFSVLPSGSTSPQLKELGRFQLSHRPLQLLPIHPGLDNSGPGFAVLNDRGTLEVFDVSMT